MTHRLSDQAERRLLDALWRETDQLSRWTDRTAAMFKILTRKGVNFTADYTSNADDGWTPQWCAVSIYHNGILIHFADRE